MLSIPNRVKISPYIYKKGKLYIKDEMVKQREIQRELFSKKKIIVEL